MLHGYMLSQLGLSKSAFVALIKKNLKFQVAL